MKEAGKCRFTAEELYRDQWLFHGEALQALTHVGTASPYGIEGTLTVLPLRDLLPADTFPRLHTDPIVLDAFTHLLGGWGLDKQAGEEGDVMFPLRLGELTIFGEVPAPGTEFACRITIREITRHRVHAEAEIVNGENRVWMRLRDWYDWRFYWPGQYRDVFRQPKTIFVGEPLPIDDPMLRAVWMEPPVNMGKPVWRDVLEWCQLSPEERDENRALSDAEPALSHRIWTRVAAKEVARRLWLDQGLPSVYPADLGIDVDQAGNLHVQPMGGIPGGDPATIAVTASEGIVLAVGTVDASAKIGVSIERIGVGGSSRYTSDERSWLDLNTTTGPDRTEWTLRFVTAKKAAGKATGLKLEVIEADLETGTLTLRAEQSPDERLLPVRTGRRGDHVWAVATGKGMDR